MLANLLVAALASSMLAAPKAGGHLLFGQRNAWWEFDCRNETTRAVTFPAGLMPMEAAISPDGRLIAFTATSPTTRNVTLFLWSQTRAGAPPVQIGDSRGYHSDPIFSSDGGWIYFAHNPNAGGPPGHHEAQAYAQIYRVRPDGTGLAALTNEPGCHYSPSVGRDGRLAFVHSNCIDHQFVQLYSTDTRMAREPAEWGGNIDEVAFSSDGHSVFRVTRTVDTFIFSVARGNATPRRILAVRRYERACHPQTCPGRRGLYFFNQHAIWRLDYRTAALTKIVATPGKAQ